MNIPRQRRLIATHFASWCFAALLLCALQPFLFTHFQCDGWEDEPGFRVRNMESMALFTPDDREGHSRDLETTLYVPASAHIDVPDALQRGLDVLMALVLLLVPLTVALSTIPMPRGLVVHHGRIPFPSGAPPPTRPWRSRPPKTAPP